MLEKTVSISRYLQYRVFSGKKIMISKAKIKKPNKKNFEHIFGISKKGVKISRKMFTKSRKNLRTIPELKKPRIYEHKIKRLLGSKSFREILRWLQKISQLEKNFRKIPKLRNRLDNNSDINSFSQKISERFQRNPWACKRSFEKSLEIEKFERKIPEKFVSLKNLRKKL